MLNKLRRKADSMIEMLSENDSSNRKTLFSMFENFNWLAIENILRTVLGLVIFALMARYLGPEEFGQYNFAFAIVGLFSVLSTLGLEGIVVKRIVNDKSQATAFLGSSLALRLIGSALLIVSSFVYLFFSKNLESQVGLFVFIFAFSYVLKSFEVVDYWFQAEVKSKLSVYARSAGFFIGVGFRLFFIWQSYPLEYFVYVALIEQIISSALMLLFYSKVNFGKFRLWLPSGEIMKSLLMEGWPLILGGISSMIYMKIDQIMIGQMLGTTELGHYYSAVKLSESWYFIPSAIAVSVFPAILKAKRVNQETYNRRLQLLFDLLVWMGIGLSVVVFLLAPYIVYILGDKYTAAIPVLRIHIWTNVFIFIGALSAKWVIAEGLVKNALLRSVSGAILNFVLNIFLIPAMGISGAAIATIISYAYVSFLSMALFKETRSCFILALKAFYPIRLLKSMIKWLS